MSRTKIAHHFYALGVQQARTELQSSMTKTAGFPGRSLAKMVGLGGLGGYGALALARNASHLPFMNPELAKLLEAGGGKVENYLLNKGTELGHSGMNFLGDLQYDLGNRLSQSGRAYSELGSDIAEYARGAGGSLMDYLASFRNLGG